MAQSRKIEFNVLVTQLKISYPFLKIFAINLDNPKRLVVEQKLKNQYNDCPELLDVPDLGVWLIGKTGKDSFERCRVITKNSGASRNVHLEFVDRACNGYLPLRDIRPLNDSELQSRPSFAKEFILSEIYIKSGNREIYKPKIIKMHDIIVHNNVKMLLIGENIAGTFVELKMGSLSIQRDIIPYHPDFVGIIGSCDLKTQMKQASQTTEFLENEISSVKYDGPHESPENALKRPSTCGNENFIYICNSEDGPSLFFVHFKNAESYYQKFQIDLQNGPYRLLKKNASSGTVCLCHYDNSYHRVSVIGPSPVPTELCVQFMEKGSKAMVKKADLYEIPRYLAIIPPLAKKYSLHDANNFRHLHKRELKFYFDYITLDRQLTIKNIENNESANSRSISKCDLYDGNKNISDEIREWNPHKLKYPEQKMLTKRVYEVYVGYIRTLREFFVLMRDEKINEIIQKLQRFNAPQLMSPKKGDCCVVKHDGTNFRGLIQEKISPYLFRILLIDNGSVENVHVGEIKLLANEFCINPSFAYKCCLEGFEMTATNDLVDIDKFYDICTKTINFNMEIKRIDGDIYIVELRNRLDLQQSVNEMLINTPNINDSADSAADTDDSETEENSKHERLNPNSVYKSPRNKMICSFIESPARRSTNNNNKEPITVHSTPEWNESDKRRSEKIVKTNSDAGPSHVKEHNHHEQCAKSDSSGIGSIPPNDELYENGVITGIINAYDFTIQRLEDAKKFEAFKNHLQVIAGDARPLMDIDVGIKCIAFCTLDQCWYRSIILDTSIFSEVLLVSVRAFDTGFTFSVDNLKHLRLMTSEIESAPCFALKCTLPIHVPLYENEDVIMSNIREMKEVKFYCVAACDIVNYVEMMNEGSNVTDTIVTNNLATRQTVVTSGPAFISYIKSPTDFFVQTESDSYKLQAISTYFSDYRQVLIWKVDTNIKCAAYREADVTWYRARIIEVLEKSFIIQYIDFGDIEEVKKVGRITNQDIERIPPLAKRCSLILPQDEWEFPPEAAKKLVQISAQGRRKIYVKMIKPTVEKANVEIYDDDKRNIIHDLVPACEKAKSSEIDVTRLSCIDLTSRDCDEDEF